MVNDIDTRHGFLAELHSILRPPTYLEIGVQTGASLALAQPPTFAIGIDPNPVVSVPLGAEHEIFQMASDTFFSARDHDLLEYPLSVDLAFIDGMHLFEFAARDYFNVERYCHRQSVIVFDDVLPRNQEEASRTMCPGDWTGDVWKLFYFLAEYCPRLNIRLVDTSPTGLMIITNPNMVRDHRVLDQVEPWAAIAMDSPVPDLILSRKLALAPEDALRHLTEELGI